MLEECALGSDRKPNMPARTREPISSARSRAIILSLFLFSGVSGLIYEVVWSRQFALVLGSTVHAAAAVLGVFMGGLALGSWFFGRIADRPGSNGLRIYGGLELAIGAFALLVLPLMRLSDVIYRAAWPAVSDSASGLMALRLLLSVMILIVPSTLMGGTLPVLSRFLVRAGERSGREIGTLYAVNTLGAVFGCFVTGFFLLELLGLRVTIISAAAVNFTVGIAALLWSRRATVTQAEDPLKKKTASSAERLRPGLARLVLALYCASGFAALALEVIWTRSLLYFVSADTWAFAAMLSAFLTGLGLGSLAMARVVGRIRHPALALGLLQVLIGLSAAASIPLFDRLHGAFTSVAEAMSDQSRFLDIIVTRLSVSFVIMLAPTLLMGATFPLASAIYVGARRQIGRGVGTLYALNTMGAIGGSLAAGFVLIPALGLQRGVLLCSSIYVLLGLLLCSAAPRRKSARRAAGAVLVLGAAALAAANLGFEGRPVILRSRFFKNPADVHKLLFYDEGSAASLAVIENRRGTKLLNINGITTAINNYRDMQVHRMLAHLPLLLHPRPEQVLVIGFGMGSTPWGCCQHDEVRRVDVVELLPAEKHTAPFFEDVNHNVLEHPKLNFVVGDGRNYVLGTRATYDVVSFNAIHPRYSAALYTEDFYRLCRERLAPDGVICAWMTQNSMRESEFRMLCRSFVDVFPNSSLWYCNPEHFCLVGTMEPTAVDFDRWRERMAAPRVRDDLADSNFADPFVLLTRFMIGPEGLARYVAGAQLNTDDMPRIEFTRHTKREERPTVERLIQLRESVSPFVTATADADWVRDRLAAYERAAGLMMIGQMEFWYPRPEAPLASQIAMRQALLASPGNQDVRENLGFSGRFKSIVQARLTESPDNPGLLTRMGIILTEEGRLAAARDHLIRALEAHNRFLPAAEQLGLVYLLEGNLPEAANWLKGVVTRFKRNDARLLYALSVALERGGRVAEAAPYRAAARKADPRVGEWFDLFERCVQALRSESRTPATRPGGG